MIYFDVTKSSSSSHRSGLTRVSGRILSCFPVEAVRRVIWRDGFVMSEQGGRISFSKSDWILTPELFSEAERPGFWKFLRSNECRVAAIFHDAIPLKFPSITWPQSVSRHPEYMKMLASFDAIWAVSEASRNELSGWWRWCRLDSSPPIEVLELGADFSGKGRSTIASPRGPIFLCVGILEPRKNQLFLLKCCEQLWSEGCHFELYIVGRVNPHFGSPVVEEIKRLKHSGRSITYIDAATDEVVEDLYSRSRATLFPTIAEGCGLPLLESLWMGLPCIASDLPPLRENAGQGGCTLVPANDQQAWISAMRTMLTDDGYWQQKCAEASERALPTWHHTTDALLARLK